MAGEYVEPEVGPEKVELATRDLAVCEERVAVLAQRPDLARHEPSRGEAIRVRGDIHCCAEARMRDRAVVALEEVLAGDLPVRVELELGAETEFKDVHVEDLRQLRRHVAQRIRKGHGLRIRVDEDERAPRVDLDLLQPELVGVEAGLAIRARRSPQPAVEAVRPRVVGTLERLPLARAAGDDVSAVPADVEERPQLAVTRACNNYRDLAGSRCEEASGFPDLSQVTRVLPGAGENPLALAAQHVGVGIPGPGQRPLHA